MAELTLKEGMLAPDFVLESQDGKEIKVSTVKAQSIVLFFYPKDDTPGCTIEAGEFSSLADDFKKAGATVFGISGLDTESKKKFCKKHSLNLTLLSDPDFSVCRKYWVYGPKTFMGKSYEGIYRTTFVVDKARKILKVYSNVTPAGHAKEVLEFVRNFKV